MPRRERINGVDVAFDDSGEGGALVLLHPFPFDRRFWTDNVPPLTAAGYRVIALDYPGVGDSPPPARALSIAGLGDLVAGLLDQLAIDRATIVGLSMGGYVALAFAAGFPDRLAALVLADTRAADDGVAVRQGREQAIATIRDRGVDAYLDQSLPRLLAPAVDSQLTMRVRALAQTHAEGLIAGIVALRDRPDRSVVLGRIACPTLVIVGETDQISPVAEMSMIANAIPGARLVEIPGAGHLSSIETPAAFNQAVLVFLSAVHLKSVSSAPAAASAAAASATASTPVPAAPGTDGR